MAGTYPGGTVQSHLRPFVSPQFAKVTKTMSYGGEHYIHLHLPWLVLGGWWVSKWSSSCSAKASFSESFTGQLILCWREETKDAPPISPVWGAALCYRDLMQNSFSINSVLDVVCACPCFSECQYASVALFPGSLPLTSNYLDILVRRNKNIPDRYIHDRSYCIGPAIC